MNDRGLALQEANKTLLELGKLTDDLGLRVTLLVCINTDNQAAIKQLEKEASSSQAKHVDGRLNVIDDYYREGAHQPTYVTTHDMIDDILNKPIPAPRIQALRAASGLE
uniref:AlNc14C404G11407 protein n=1 Tax=Albugo laibachii Nc14 TaxID=890382 RepID=F0WYZ7_9STRA|nr:AlNc14C404G11407 [Albugo laibachii Nc14]CCA27882.1 AlNc14C792G12516 [Albugo laibachii Nc14]|eukprot:CCA27882.1 AlNc14C792G12516 [Albugo laibachii Nc14]